MLSKILDEIKLPNQLVLANEIARSYNVLSSYEYLIRLFKDTDIEEEISTLSKYEVHRFINELLINHYYGELVIKANLVHQFTEEIFAFEVPAISSRLDFLIINGNTHAFEIKSKLDNLDRLVKQLEDFLKLFDFVNLVLDKAHYTKIIDYIPLEVGIYIYDEGCLISEREATTNNNLVPEQQLELFTKKDLKSLSCKTKKEMLECYGREKINELFRSVLKDRYVGKTKFLKENLSKILPIDYQYFFKHNIEPSIIYR